MRQITPFLFMFLGALFLTAQSTEAFDGNRKGFNLGLGIGYSPSSRISVDDLGISPTDNSLVISLSIGYAFGRDFITYEPSIFAVEHGLEDESPCCRSVTVVGDFARWYHYFSDEGRSFFSCVGTGFTDTDGYSNFLTGRGLGFVVGGGYEFLKQIQAGVYYIGGYSKGDGFTYGTRSLQFVLHVIAY